MFNIILNSYMNKYIYIYLVARTVLKKMKLAGMLQVQDNLHGVPESK